MKWNLPTLWNYRPFYLFGRVLVIFLSIAIIGLLAAVNKNYVSDSFSDIVRTTFRFDDYWDNGTFYRTRIDSRKVIMAALVPPAVAIALAVIELISPRFPGALTILFDIIAATGFSIEASILSYCYRRGWRTTGHSLHNQLFSAFILYLVVLFLIIWLMIASIVWVANGGPRDVEREENGEGRPILVAGGFQTQQVWGIQQTPQVQMREHYGNTNWGAPAMMPAAPSAVRTSEMMPIPERAAHRVV